MVLSGQPVDVISAAKRLSLDLIMSLMNWLVKANPKLQGRYEESKRPGLPDPNTAPSETDAASWSSANNEVEKAYDPPSAKRRLRGDYFIYNDDLRL